MPSYSPGKARTSQRTTTATEVRAGATTFMVMAYIIFVNPLILGFGGVPGLEGKGLPFAPTLTVTCLSAGLLSIAMGDRKSTRLNSSHVAISYAVFCLKKKKPLYS